MLRRLGEAIRQQMQEKRLSNRDVADRSGGAISFTTVNSIVNHRTNDVGLLTIVAVASGLGVNPLELIAAALTKDTKNNFSVLDPVAESILDKFSQLTTAEKQQLMPYLKVLEREINELPKPVQKKKAS